MLFLYLLLVAIYVWLHVLSKRLRNERLSRRLDGLRRRLFFGMILTIGLEAYIELLVSSHLNLQAMLTTFSGEKVSAALTVFNMAFCLGLLPLAALFVFAQPLKKLSNTDFIERWGTLYEDLNFKHSKWPLAYPLVFLLRRMILTALIFKVDIPVLQIIGIVLMNTGVMIFQGSVQPIVGRLRNKIELANEAFVSVSCVHVICFTDFVPSKDAQFSMGYSIVSVFSACILFNLVFILKSGLHVCRLVLRKFIKKLRLKSNKIKKRSQIK